MAAIADVKLNDLVNDIGGDDQRVNNLGFALDYKHAEVELYVTSNHQGGHVTCTGTRKMVFNWKAKTHPKDQVAGLRRALSKANLVELAAIHFPKRDCDLKCRECESVVANTSNIINDRISDDKVKSRNGNILGTMCIVQLFETEDVDTKKYLGKREIITLTDADLKIDEKECRTDSNYAREYFLWCKSCSTQIGWYHTPDASNSSLKPFYELCLEEMITNDYHADDNELNMALAGLHTN